MKISVKFSLILWWGGAKWYIHLGAYKYFCENKIIPSDIVGTSMGSIIGTMIAFNWWYDRIYEEMKRFSLHKIVWIPSSRGMIPHKRIELYAQKIFWKSQIEDSHIPLSIISYDISSWKKVIFQTWSVTQALITSSSIPWVFAPYKNGETLLMDGWIGHNLPCEEAKTDTVIAISTMGASLPLDEKSTIMTLCLRSLTHLVRRNEECSVLEAEHIYHKKVNIIRPDLSSYEMYHFDKYDELIEIWYTATKEFFEKKLK